MESHIASYNFLGILACILPPLLPPKSEANSRDSCSSPLRHIRDSKQWVGMYRPLEVMRQRISNFEKIKPVLLGAETDTQAPKVYEIYVVDLQRGRQKEME